MALINTNTYLLLFLLGVALFPLLVRADGDALERGPLKDEDWKPIHYVAYASGGHFLKPNETLELLKELERIYEPYDNRRETNGRKGKVRRLVAASELNRAKCTRNHLDELFKLRDYVSPYKHTIVPYVGHSIVEYLDYCEDWLLHNLHDGVRDMAPEHKLNIRTLTNTITQIHFNGYALGFQNLRRVWMHFTHLIDGLVLFMRLQLGNSFQKLDEIPGGVAAGNRKWRFNQAFERHVMDMCRDWMRLTDPIEAFHELDLRLHYDEQEFEWISYGKFCHFLDRHTKSIRGKTWRQFQRRQSNFSSLRIQTHRKLKKFNCRDPFA